MTPPLPSDSQAVLPNPRTLVLDRIERNEKTFRIFVYTRQAAVCPTCNQSSTSRHSRYSRRLSDVPWQGLSVHIWLSVHRYRCRNRQCSQRVFCERVPGVTRVYARQTDRLADIVGVVGYIAGGLPGVRLLDRLAIATSDDTVRRRVSENIPSSQQQPIRHLGVDDWAWRKYQSYGTILVDLDRHCVADLLPDRSAETLSVWLTKHPTVEVITRDRSGLYAEGASQGAPSAMQVADRFHLVLNLSAAIERVLEERSRELILPPNPLIPCLPSEYSASTVDSGAKPTMQHTLQQQRRKRRLERYQQVIELHQKGYSKKAISRELKIECKTIRRWLRAGEFPERKPPSGRRQKVAAFGDYLQQRWNEGCRNATQLTQEIRARGYKGSRQLVGYFVSKWRKTARPSTKPVPPDRVAPKHAAILAARAPDKITEEQQSLFDRLVINCPDLVRLRGLALEFRQALATKDGAVLQRWIDSVQHCDFAPLMRFGYGLQKDIAAVTAAVETDWSNGQVEGQVNRLKAIKRQMYGRAGFDLLRARVLPFHPASIPALAHSP
jgi:transposase